MKSPWELPTFSTRLLFLWVFLPFGLDLVYIYHLLSLGLGCLGFLLGRVAVYPPAFRQSHLLPCLTLLFYKHYLDCLFVRSVPKDCPSNSL